MTEAGPYKEARYWHQVEEGVLQCDLCPHHCRLREGQRGACFVRMVQNGRLVTTTYGRNSGLAIDPIEKKPLYHFLPGSGSLSFGTAGCNLRCRYCQNWTLSKSRETETCYVRALPVEIAQAAVRENCRSVSFTYNDPVVFFEYAVDTAIECHRRGIRTVAVTAGFICDEPRREFFRHMDAANIDFKSINPDFYRRLCGGDVAVVMDTLRYVKKETSTWLEVTNLIIPGENDSEDEIRALAEWVYRELGADTPLHFTAFYPAYQMTDHPPTPPQTLHYARRLAREIGLRYVYTGNIRDPEGSTTYCPSCGRELIIRSGFSMLARHVGPDGRCEYCGAVCAGVFD
ncbi:MAG: AmmeMemoRadiSam system radical SAM enzyme [Verrucomicrobia bacterium]|nr:MAG: AmmeMemoRadiSam system radical SAM enzyme [Verrucomicrobiota bacterium]